MAFKQILLFGLVIQLTKSAIVRIFVPHNIHHHTHTNTRYRLITQPPFNQTQANIFGVMPIFTNRQQQPLMPQLQPVQPIFQMPPQQQQPILPQQQPQGQFVPQQQPQGQFIPQQQPQGQFIPQQQPQGQFIPQQQPQGQFGPQQQPQGQFGPQQQPQGQFGPQQQPQGGFFGQPFQQLQSAQARNSNNNDKARGAYDPNGIRSENYNPVKYKTIINVHDGGGVPFKELLAMHLLGKQYDSSGLNEFDYTLKNTKYQPETSSFYSEEKNHQGISEDSFNTLFKDDYTENELIQLRYLMEKHLGKTQPWKSNDWEAKFQDRIDGNATEVSTNKL